jgi:hypothetical protein
MKFISNKLFDKIEKAIKIYIGLKKPKAYPIKIKKTKNSVCIVNTTPFKRHLETQAWKSFNDDEFHKLNDKSKIILGNALGKSIATNLIVSFDEVKDA